MRTLAMVSLSALMAISCGAAETRKAAEKPAEKWINLFDGKSLKGWMILSGFATYDVEDGAIVGRSREFSGNTFLCTDKSYGDFILEFEVNCDPALNSGVQFRSHVYGCETTQVLEKDGKQIKRTWPAGRVYGYQVEIADEASGTSGGIYDEARKGVWLYDNSKNPTGSKAFKDHQWNKYRVECRGSSIKTWINGVPCTTLVDDTDASGFIGLQVHGIRGDKRLEVRFRNIRLQDLGGKK
jgi:hypothetical protein